MHWTPEHDQRIRELYTPPYDRGACSRLAKEWGCRMWQINYRANRQLGLPILRARDKYTHWRDEEIKVLRDHPTLSHRDVQKRLHNLGYSRSLASISNKRLEIGWRHRLDRDEFEIGYTAESIANLLGVHHTTPIRWIRMGKLKARRDGHAHRISRKQLYEFLTTHVSLWEPGKADKFWLIDLLTNPVE